MYYDDGKIWNKKSALHGAVVELKLRHVETDAKEFEGWQEDKGVPVPEYPMQVKLQFPAVAAGDKGGLEKLKESFRRCREDFTALSEALEAEGYRVVNRANPFEDGFKRLAAPRVTVMQSKLEGMEDRTVTFDASEKDQIKLDSPTYWVIGKEDGEKAAIAAGERIAALVKEFASRRQSASAATPPAAGQIIDGWGGLEEPLPATAAARPPAPPLPHARPSKALPAIDRKVQAILAQDYAKQPAALTALVIAMAQDSRRTVAPEDAARKIDELLREMTVAQRKQGLGEAIIRFIRSLPKEQGAAPGR